MPDPQYLGIFLVAFLTAYGLTPLVIRLAHGWDMVDRPGGRRINVKPVPRPGGLAIFIAMLLALLVMSPLLPRTGLAPITVILLGAAVNFCLGFADDKYDLKASIKLLVQIGAALLVWRLGLRISYVSNPMADPQATVPGALIFLPPWFSAVLTVFWLVGITNAVNFIDGLDGLAAGVSAIAGVTLFLVAFSRTQIASAALACAMVGAALGFLRWNFFPAKIFMGDSGAYMLGFMLAAVAIQGAFKSTASLALATPILALLVPIMDTTLAVIRRVSKGMHPFAADRAHLHHWLMDRGLGHRRTVVFLYCVTTLLCILSLVLARSAELVPWLIGILAAVILALSLAGKVKYGPKDADTT